MPDLATILEDPQEEGAWIVKRTDPATVPPDYNPIPRRFPSDPRISRANPLGSPFLPKGTMTRKQMFAAFREVCVSYSNVVWLWLWTTRWH